MATKGSTKLVFQNYVKQQHALDQITVLLLEGSSMFFFCPFSRADILLPQFPCPESPDLVAAFSSPHTCKDCIVSVICKSGDYLEIHMLQRGASSWTMHRFVRDPARIDAINGAAYWDSDKSFYFFDRAKGLVIFSVRDKEPKTYHLLPPSKDSSIDIIPFCIRTDHRKIEYLKIEFVFENVSVSACGTVIGESTVLCNEKINMDADQMVKGVWIHPRFFELSPQQSIW